MFIIEPHFPYKFTTGHEEFFIVTDSVSKAEEQFCYVLLAFIWCCDPEWMLDVWSLSNDLRHAIPEEYEYSPQRCDFDTIWEWFTKELEPKNAMANILAEWSLERAENVVITCNGKRIENHPNTIPFTTQMCVRFVPHAVCRRPS